MDNIDVNKENWIKSIRELYSAVNELVDILGRDISGWEYDKETLDKKIQAYISYFSDNKEWEWLAKWKNNDEDRDFLFNKVQDDVSDIMSLSTSKEDADKARKALRQLSDATSTEVVDVLRGCLDDGWKTGEHTRYAKKKLIMNNVSSIYEKEETSNWAELYYNLVHWKYQILNGDKIYTTKRGGSEKKQELDLKESVSVKEVWDSTMEQIEENAGEKPINVETIGGDADQTGVLEEVVEQHENISGQSNQLKTIDEKSKVENERLEDEFQWSEEKVIEELENFQNIEGFKELQRCNDVELSFLVQQLLKSTGTIDLLKKISVSEGNEWNNEELLLEFKSKLSELFKNFVVNPNYFNSHDINEEITWKTWFRLMKKKLCTSLWLWKINDGINELKTISEYMSFIWCLSNIKNSVIETKNQIRWTRWMWALQYLLWQKKEKFEICSDVEKYLIRLLCRKIEEFENLKKDKSSIEMKRLEKAIESDFNSLISKNSEGNYSLKECVIDEIKNLVENKKNVDINWLMDLFLPVFIKIWVLNKANDTYSHRWIEHIRFYPVIKYVINWKAIELSIAQLKNFKETVRPALIFDYFDFKNVVLYAIYKTIKESKDCPYAIELEKDDYGNSSFTVYDKRTRGEQYFEDSHYGNKLEKVFDREKLVVNNDSNSSSSTNTQIDTVYVRESTISHETVEVNNVLAEIQMNREERGDSSDEAVEIRVDNVKDERNEVETPKKMKNKWKQKQVPEWNDNIRSVTIEDIINFYKDDNNRRGLENLRKVEGVQKDYADLRKKYVIKINKQGCKKRISLKLENIAEIVCGEKISKPYMDKRFDKIFDKLSNLLEK